MSRQRALTLAYAFMSGSVILLATICFWHLVRYVGNATDDVAGWSALAFYIVCEILETHWYFYGQKTR